MSDFNLRRYRTIPIVWFTKFIWNANGFAHQRGSETLPLDLHFRK